MVGYMAESRRDRLEGVGSKSSRFGSIGMASGASDSNFVPHNAPRIGDARIHAAGGTVEELMAALLEGVRVGTMDVKERSAAALRSLADQSEAHSASIGKTGLSSMVALLASGTNLAQVHAAATVAITTLKSHDRQIEVVRMGAVDPLILMVRSSGAAAEQASAALASITTATENQKGAYRLSLGEAQNQRAHPPPWP